MKTSILSIALLVVCCLFLAQNISAQETPEPGIDSYTSIDYDPDTNIVTAYSETDVDYGLWGDYYAHVLLQVTGQNDVPVATQGNTDLSGNGYTSVTIQFSGDPATTYTARGIHQAYASLYSYDDFDRLFYFDNYFFTSFESRGIYEPYYYYFLSPGYQPVYRRTRPINLGKTYDSASVTTPRPHHLRVISDDTFIRECGSLERRIVYQAVDVNEHSTGLTPTSEYYPDATDTCNNSTVKPSRCSTDNSDGTFTDRLTVDCPSSGGSCGFEVNANWYWCPRGRTPKRLATIPYVVHHDRITVNGIDKLNPGTDFEP